MKKVLIFLAALVVLIVVLFFGAVFYFIYSDNEKTARIPQNLGTPPVKVEITVPNPDGQPGTQISFDFEVVFEPLIEFYGEAFPVKILSTAALNSYPDGSPE